MKVVINTCFGGFSISLKAMNRMQELGYVGLSSDPIFGDWVYLGNIKRNDPILVQVVEELGKDSWSRTSELKVVEISDNINWHISEYDGMETIHEDHQVWS